MADIKESIIITDKGIEETVKICGECSSELEDSYINIFLAILSEPFETDTTERGKVHLGGPYHNYIESGTLVFGQC